MKDLAKQLSESINGFCRANINQRSNLPIRSSEMGALIYINENAGESGVKAVDLSDYFGIQKSSVSAMISSLDRQGYITRSIEETDKRSSPLFPTEKGKVLVKETIDVYQKVANRLITKLGEEKCAEFIDDLTLFTKLINEGVNE